MSKLNMSHVSSKILDILKVDARSTISEIASRVGVSRTTAKEKIDMMIEKGIIRRFTVELGADQKVDNPPERAVFEVQLTSSACRFIYKEIHDWPEIVGCYSLMGDIDMLIIIQTNENSRIEELREELSKISYVKKVQTRAILRKWDTVC